MKLSHTNENENWRMDRLKSVRMDLLQHDDLDIYSIDDHKGLLTVKWESVPTKEQMEIVRCAWENKNEYEVDHILCRVVVTDIGLIK